MAILPVDNPITWIIIAASVIGAWFLFTRVMRLRQPEGKRIDVCIFNMPYSNKIFKAAVHENVWAQKILSWQAVQEIPEAKGLADVVINALKLNKLFFYECVYERHDHAFKDNGRAIMMTHVRIDADGYSPRLDSQFNPLTFEREQIRVVVQSSELGEIYENAIEVDGKAYDLIYYNMMKPVAGEQELVQIANPYGTMTVAALVKNVAENKAEIRQWQAKAAALEKTNSMALSEIGLQVNLRGVAEVEKAKKPPFSLSGELERAGLSTAIIVMIMIGCIAVFPPIIQRVNPTIESNMAAIFSAMIGGAFVFLASRYLSR